MGRGSGVAVSCGVGLRHGSDPSLLWVWRRPVATAPIRPLAWEPPYAAGAAQEIATTTTTKDKKKDKKKKEVLIFCLLSICSFPLYFEIFDACITTEILDNLLLFNFK